jgi:hypothetical protein
VDLGHQGGRGTPHKTFEFLSRSCQTGCSGSVASCRGDCGCGKTWQRFDGELSTAKLPRERETLSEKMFRLFVALLFKGDPAQVAECGAKMPLSPSSLAKSTDSDNSDLVAACCLP